MRLSRLLRPVLGLVVSGLLIWATLLRVDLDGVRVALARAVPAAVLLGAVLAFLELAARAWRWQYLLKPIGRMSFPRSLAYMCIGTFGNVLLPLRLGDVARGYLVAGRLGFSQLATLGSIGAERAADGVTILALALVFALLNPNLAPIVTGSLAVGLAATVALGLVVAGVVAARRRQRFARAAAFVQLIDRLAPGARATTTPIGLICVLAYTMLAYCFSVGAIMAATQAVGIHMSLVACALAMSCIALSTAIPAAPGSIGTFEFVGVTVLSALHQDPSASLAAVVLLHAVVTIPPSMVGLVLAVWWHVPILARGSGSTRPELALAQGQRS